MNKFVIPPSPSWYLSNIIACNHNGDVAYGARHEVALMEKNKNSSPTDNNYNYRFIPIAHKERITSLAFAPVNASDDFKNCLVTSSDDGSVRLWDLKTLDLKMINHDVKDKQKVTAVDWSVADPNLVFSINEQSVIHCWDLSSNKLRKVYLGLKMAPFCLAVCPHDKYLVAVGGKNGLIVIVNLKGSGSIKYRLRSHDGDVTSLSWCPVKYNVFSKISHNKTIHSQTDIDSKNSDELMEKNDIKDNENKKSKAVDLHSEKPNEYLLASVAKDRSIFFWRAGTDGRYETVLNLPHQPMASGGRYRSVGEKGIWGCVRWIDPYTVITGSQFGELLLWDLSTYKGNDKEKKHSMKSITLLHACHSKGIFSISCPVMNSKKDVDDRVIWTTALDKRLVGYSLKSGEVITEMTTIAGIVYCMAISPLDPNRIAIGSSDSKILLWNMGNVDKVDISTLWQKINNKVMSLEWHPTEDNWLAFATSEGRVGLFDVNSVGKPPIIFRHYHQKSVYRLLWAPHIIVKNQNHQQHEKYELALFSVGDGEILQHSVNRPESVPENLKDILKKADESSKLDRTPQRTEFVMNHDRSLSAVGHENGLIYILDGKTYEKKISILTFKKIVQCLNWHPSSVTSDPTAISPYANWLAAASEVIKVFNVNEDGTSYETVAVLALHSERVVDINWSPHVNGHLISASYDYTVQVWDVIKQAPLANYSEHHNAVMCALWSPLNPECVISGSSDGTCRVWRVHDQVDVRPSEKKKNRINNLLKRMTCAPAAICPVEKNPLSNNNIKREAIATVHLSSAVVKSGGTGINQPGKSEDMNPISEWDSGHIKKLKGRSMFPVIAAALNTGKHLDDYYLRWKSSKNKNDKAIEIDTINNDCKSNSSDLKNDAAVNSSVSISKEKEKELAYLDFFGDRDAIRRLMKLEEEHLLQENRPEHANYCNLWRGDVNELIREAINKKALNSWLMSLAPMASYRLWQEAASVYAEQLVNEGDILKATSYLLTIHKVEEALDILCEHKFFREAVALAKCRLSKDDPLWKTVVNRYAEFSLSHGQIFLAAHCYLSLDDPVTASQILVRCKDLKSLRLAATLAREGNANELADSFAKEAFCSLLMAGDYDACSKIVVDHQNLEYLKIWINVNKMVSKNKKIDMSVILSWFNGRKTNIESVFEMIKKDAMNYESCYTKLKSDSGCFNALDTEKQLWLFISSQLSMAGAANSHTETLTHLVRALATAYKFQTLNDKSYVLLQLCILLSPQGLPSEDSIFRYHSDNSDEMNLVSSMHSFLFAGIIYWVNDHLDDVKQYFSNDQDAFSWLDSIIDFCQTDLFNVRNIEYIKNNAMIEKLELKIASNNCVNDKREKRVVLTAVRGKNKKVKSDEIKDKVDKGEKTSGENGEIHNNASLNDKIKDAKENKNEGSNDGLNKTSNNKITDEMKDNSEKCLKDENDQYNVDKPNNNIESNDVGDDQHHNENGNLNTGCVIEKASKTDSAVNGCEQKTHENNKLKSTVSVKVVENDSQNGKNSKHSLVIELNKVDDLKSLQNLNEMKSKFESEKIATPNPFHSYCQLQNVLKVLFMDKDPVKYSLLNNKIQDTWKKEKL